MNYAEVAVNSPRLKWGQTFCYAIPPGLNLNVGQAVWVPFGSRVVQGIVLLLSDEPSVAETKEIAGVVADCPLLSPIQIELGQWISEHYFAPLFDALALMLPPGSVRRTVTYFQLTAPDLIRNQVDLSLTPEQKQILHIIMKKKKASLPELEKVIGKRKTRQITDQLLDRKLITKSLELETAKIKPKTLPHIRLITDKKEIEAAKAQLTKSRAYKQTELLEFLAGQARPISIIELKKRLNCSSATIKALESRHLVSVEKLRVRRDPLAHLSFKSSPPPVLTSSQQVA